MFLRFSFRVLLGFFSSSHRLRCVRYQSNQITTSESLFRRSVAWPCGFWFKSYPHAPPAEAPPIQTQPPPQAHARTGERKTRVGSHRRTARGVLILYLVSFFLVSFCVFRGSGSFRPAWEGQGAQEGREERNRRSSTRPPNSPLNPPHPPPHQLAPFSQSVNLVLCSHPFQIIKSPNRFPDQRGPGFLFPFPHTPHTDQRRRRRPRLNPPTPSAPIKGEEGGKKRGTHARRPQQQQGGGEDPPHQSHKQRPDPPPPTPPPPPPPRLLSSSSSSSAGGGGGRRGNRDDKGGGGDDGGGAWGAA